MNGYELRNLTDGTVELVEISPTVIATFHNRAHAERYFNILVETGVMVPEMPKLDAPTALDAGDAPAAPSQEEWDRASMAIANGDEMRDVAEMLGVTFYQMRGRYSAWKRRQNAKNAKTENAEADADAEEQAEPEPEPKAARQPSVPAVMQSKALTSFVSLIPNDIEPANCRLCDRPFNASAHSDGLCARCRRD